MKLLVCTCPTRRILYNQYTKFHSNCNIFNNISPRSLSYDRATVSSKANPPNSTTQCFLFQFPAYFHFLKITQSLLTSSSSFPFHFYPYIYFSFNNMSSKVVPTQDMTNPTTLSSFYCVGYSYPPWIYVILPHFLHDRFKWPSPSFSSIFQNLQLFRIYFPKCEVVATHKAMFKV